MNERQCFQASRRLRNRIAKLWRNGDRTIDVEAVVQQVPDEPIQIAGVDRFVVWLDLLGEGSLISESPEPSLTVLFKVRDAIKRLEDFRTRLVFDIVENPDKWQQPPAIKH